MWLLSVILLVASESRFERPIDREVGRPELIEGLTVLASWLEEEGTPLPVLRQDPWVEPWEWVEPWDRALFLLGRVAATRDPSLVPQVEPLVLAKPGADDMHRRLTRGYALRVLFECGAPAELFARLAREADPSVLGADTLPIQASRYLAVRAALAPPGEADALWQEFEDAARRLGVKRGDSWHAHILDVHGMTIVKRHLRSFGTVAAETAYLIERAGYPPAEWDVFWPFFGQGDRADRLWAWETIRSMSEKYPQDVAEATFAHYAKWLDENRSEANGTLLWEEQYGRDQLPDHLGLSLSLVQRHSLHPACAEQVSRLRNAAGW